MEPATVPLDTIDLGDPAFWRRPIEEREGAFLTLRRERPVARFESRPPPGFEALGAGASFWAVTTYADVVRASRAPEIFSSAKGATHVLDLPEPMLALFGSFINLDDPAHVRLRKLVSGGFTPRQLARQQDYVQRIATEVIDAVIEKGSCDFVGDLSAPFAIRIICDLLGIPESQRSLVFERTHVILGASDPEYVPEGQSRVQAILEAARDLCELMRELCALRARDPRDDLTSLLVQAEIDGDRLTQDELGAFFILLATTGNETTRHALSHGLLALSQHPDQRERWLRDLEGLLPTAVDEIVRWASPVMFMRRTTTQATQLGGQAIEAGERVLLYYASANRDERAFADPYRFDLARSPNEHLGFGAPGPHFCLGASLARREIEIFFRELLTRMPDVEPTGPPERLASHFIHGIKRLGCAFMPAERLG